MYYINVRNLTTLKIGTWYSKLIKRKPPKPPYNHIIQVGDPRLRDIAEPVDPGLVTSNEVQALIKKMKNVYYNYNCVGLAGPQIGISFRIILLGFSEKQLKSYNDKDKKIKELKAHPLQVLINPTVKVTDYTKITFSESCESIKGFWADVPRFYSIEVNALDETGKETKTAFNGWLARILQHEMDHLDGKLYTDIMNRKSLACSCWQEVNLHGGNVVLPYNNK